MGYDVNDHVAFQLPVSLLGYDTTFCSVPGVSPVSAHTGEVSMSDHWLALTAEVWLVYTEHPCQCNDGYLEL